MSWCKKKKAEAKVRSFAGRAAGTAADLGMLAVGKAQDGLDWLTPRAERAWTQAQVRAAAANTRLREDYVPRVQRALHEANVAAHGEGTLSERAQHVAASARKALAEPPAKAKRRRGLRTLGWLLVGAAAAGAGYVAWRRTQPVDDPWAEDYWAESTVVPSDLQARAAGAMDAVKAKVGEAKERVADALKDGRSEAKDAARDVKDAAKDARSEAKDVVRDVKDAAKDKLS
ncbi:hypothetical protein [Buchananella hordeovulneris]|uniref:Uncharacterized protein n=1 Tax=Buchananella hordeovulneris TaxID=52770 RepID=A0A1Q5PUN3_9ACTO|nr:hypothetical protein [Buchananella hordeovulneris]MDO5081450.1 hypothetical protein [Buchananella hordeovulneris]OKL51277.1 hypothetical protein BSZ40_08175 [Buchananella hordeovulneris]RRD43412.1 hypothetical protein EII13_06790 [Buchananella hordeovulneris]RRD51029.1 hypothetical protein EII12_08825 [Buchananella hordeovulneris]